MNVYDDKKLFVKSFGDFLRKTGIANVQKIKYRRNSNNGLEIAEIYFKGSDSVGKTANITDDSHLAIIKYITGVL